MLLGLGGLATFSCKKEAETVVLPADAAAYAVTTAQATTVAENIVLSTGAIARRQHIQLAGDTQRIFLGKQRILNLTAVAAADGKPALYLCNYVRGGFAIIAADRHMQPVLAFAERGSLPTTDLRNPKVIADGLITWLENTKLIAAALRQNPSKENTAAGAAASWSAMEEPVCPDYGDGSTCDNQPTYTSTQVGPLVHSNWGQGQGYNDFTPSTNNSAYNYHSPTGCVATATGQVMRYWQWPTRFNWSNMPLNTSSYDVALLMISLGGAVSMDYGSDESGAYPDDAALALKNNYYYSSADYSSYDAGTYVNVMNNLDAGRPVIIGGFRSEFANVVPYNGHTWVCDGYISTFYDNTGYLQLHMNWGYNGQYNAWVNFDSWQIHFSDGSVRDYQYGRDIIANIHP